MKFQKFLLMTLVVFFTFTPAFAIKHEAKKQEVDYRLSAINIDWWDNFDDKHLSGYINKAIQNNHDVKIATLKTQEYQEFVKVTRAGQLPSLSLIGNYARVRTPELALGETVMAAGSMNMFAIPLVASYEADIFLKNADKTKAAKKQYEGSKYLEKSAYISLAANVATTYFNIVKLDSMVEEQKKIVSNRKKIYELTKLRNENGLSSVFDVTMTDKNYTIARIMLTDLEKERNILLNQLAVLTGDSPHNINELGRAKLSEIEYKNKIPKEISSEVALKRPDMMKAEIDLQKAGIDVRIARKEFLPSIPILGSVGFAATSFSSLFDWKNALGLIGAGFMQDLYAGGSKIANLKIKKIQYEEALENYKQADLVAIQEINDALCKIKFDTKKDEENIKKYNLEKKNFNLVQEKYKEGVISYLDLIQYEENLLALNFDITSSKVERLVDYLGLFKSVGGNL